MVSWGLWGLFPKLATNQIKPASALVYEAVGGFIVGLVCLLGLRGKPELNSYGMLFGLLAGVAALTGGYCYVNAVSRGRVSLIVTVTALYPVVTVLLAHFFLKEPLGSRQIAGLLFAILAIVLVAR